MKFRPSKSCGRLIVASWLFAAACVGCDSGVGATINPVAPTPAEPPLAASLAIESFELFEPASYTSPPGWSAYRARVTLREIGGTSTARVSTLVFTPADGYPWTLRIEEPAQLVQAGGTWDLTGPYPFGFALETTANLVGLPVRLDVGFIDANGTSGTVTASTTVQPVQAR